MLNSILIQLPVAIVLQQVKSIHRYIRFSKTNRRQFKLRVNYKTILHAAGVKTKPYKARHLSNFKYAD